LNEVETKFSGEHLFKQGLPDKYILKYLPIIPRGYVLDLGFGKGHNSVFLAENGFEVEAFDRDGKAVSTLQGIAQERGLAIRAIKNELTTLTILSKRYSLAIASWVLMYIRRGEREGLVKMAVRGLVPGGYIYLAVFSTSDPGYELCQKRKLEEIEERTYFIPKRKMPVHFFLPEEVKAMVKGLDIIAFTEGVESDVTHEECPQHGVIEVLARLPE